MALNQNNIMLGVRVRVVRGPYIGRTGTIKEVRWSDPDYHEYATSIVIKWDRAVLGRKVDEWRDYNALDEVIQPDGGPIKPSTIQAGWKVQLCAMPRSKYFRKVAEVVKVVQGDYFTVQWSNGNTTKWDTKLAPLFRGITKQPSPKKIRKLEREALLVKTFYQDEEIERWNSSWKKIGTITHGV